MDPILYFASLIITGIAAGTASGLFGVGGGFLMTPVQYWLYTLGGIDNTLATRLAFGTSLAVMIPTMISAAVAHHRHNSVNWEAAIQMGCAAVFGGLAGGTLAAHMPGYMLRTIFALLIIATAIRLVWHLHSCIDCEPRGSTGTYLAHWVSDWHRFRSCRDWWGCSARAGPCDIHWLSHAYRCRDLLGMPDFLILGRSDRLYHQRSGGCWTATLYDRLRGSCNLCNPCCNHYPTCPIRCPVRSRLFRTEFTDCVCRDSDPHWRD